MLRPALMCAMMLLASSSGAAQFSNYGSPTDPSGNLLPHLTWSGPPAIGTNVTILQPHTGWTAQGYQLACGPFFQNQLGHQLIVGVAPSSTVITPGAAPILCLPQLLLVDFSSLYVVFQMSHVIGYDPTSPDPAVLLGWNVLISVPNDPGLVGATFYAQATTYQVGPGGCTPCVYQLSQGLQAIVQ